MSISKSVRLRKYQTVYLKYMKSLEKKEKKEAKEVKEVKEVKREKKGDEKKKRENTETKKLNDYQLYVKEQISKGKYKNMSGKERLSAIATAWKTEKRKVSKKKNK